jgi:hypothetical protein
MLIHKHDAALDDAEWQDFLKTYDFGELIVHGAASQTRRSTWLSYVPRVSQCAACDSWHTPVRTSSLQR